MGINEKGLLATVQRFNRFAQSGKDEDFQRGESAYDRYYGDPSHQPNPCFGPLTEPPFYGTRLYPGDIGTKGGVVTNEKSQVLDAQGHWITGLYAAGNNSASVMGNSYPGPGSTLGPALTFGYVAARHAAGTLAME
jgi:3-oxosteroid 1-dehydrogenase